MNGLGVGNLIENQSLIILNKDKVNQTGDDDGAIVINMRPKNEGLKVFAPDGLSIFKLSAPPPAEEANSTNRCLQRFNGDCAMNYAVEKKGFNREKLIAALEALLKRAFAKKQTAA